MATARLADHALSALDDASEADPAAVAALRRAAAGLAPWTCSGTTSSGSGPAAAPMTTAQECLLRKAASIVSAAHSAAAAPTSSSANIDSRPGAGYRESASGNKGWGQIEGGRLSPLSGHPAAGELRQAPPPPPPPPLFSLQDLHSPGALCAVYMRAFAQEESASLANVTLRASVVPTSMSHRPSLPASAFPAVPSQGPASWLLPPSQTSSAGLIQRGNQPASSSTLVLAPIAHSSLPVGASSPKDRQALAVRGSGTSGTPHAAARDGFLAEPVLLYDCLVETDGDAVGSGALIRPRPRLPMWACPPPAATAGAAEMMAGTLRFVPCLAPPPQWKRPGVPAPPPSSRAASRGNVSGNSSSTVALGSTVMSQLSSLRPPHSPVAAGLEARSTTTTTTGGEGVAGGAHPDSRAADSSGGTLQWDRSSPSPGRHATATAGFRLWTHHHQTAAASVPLSPAAAVAVQLVLRTGNGMADDDLGVAPTTLAVLLEARCVCVCVCVYVCVCVCVCVVVVVGGAIPMQGVTASDLDPNTRSFVFVGNLPLAGSRPGRNDISLNSISFDCVCSPPICP